MLLKSIVRKWDKRKDAAAFKGIVQCTFLVCGYEFMMKLICVNIIQIPYNWWNDAVDWALSTGEWSEFQKLSISEKSEIFRIKVIKKKYVQNKNVTINVNNKTKQGRIGPFLETGVQRILVKNVEIRSSSSIMVTLCLRLCFSFTLTVYANLCCFVLLLTAELSLINTLAAFQRHSMVNLPFSWWIYAIVVSCPQWQKNIKFSTFFLKKRNFN